MNISVNSTSGFYLQSFNEMSELRAQLERLQTQVATGERLERSSQDPVAASRLRDIARSQRLEEINSENADRLELDLNIASDEITGITDLLIRARELTIGAGNDTLGQDSLDAIATELEQLGEELFTRANGVSLAGESLFSGDAGGAAYIRDNAGVVSYAGSAEAAFLDVAEGVAIQRGITGPEFLSFDVDGTGVTSDAFALISGLAAVLQGGAADPSAAARDAISGFDSALDSANRGQTILGARLAWLDSVQQNQLERSTSRAEEEAEIGGADLTETITELQQTLTVLEASQTSFARVSSLSLFNVI
ncbi:MAG: flagellar biosynthesis protein FlgL [Erythrobacter sp.]